MTDKPSPEESPNPPDPDDPPAASDLPTPESAETRQLSAPYETTEFVGAGQADAVTAATGPASSGPPITDQQTAAFGRSAQGFDAPPPGYVPPPAGSAPPPRHQAERLQRSSSDRLLAGVCGGLGRHFGVDPILFRVGFVALVFAAGTGILLYIALAILMPSDDGQQLWQRGVGQRTASDRSASGETVPPRPPPVPKGPRSPVPGVTLAVLLIGLGVVALTERLGDWSLEPSAYFAIAVAIVGVGLLVSAFGPWRRSKAGLIVLGLMLSLGLFVTSAVDSRGGFDHATFGARNYQPAAIDDVQGTYEVLMGETTLDLSRIAFTSEDPTEIQINVTMGDFTILVPTEADISLNGDAVFGSVSVFGNRDVIDGFYQGLGDGPNVGDQDPEIILDVDVRFGNAEVHRVG